MHLLILLAITSATETFTASVVKVKDGDSIVVERDDEQIEILLRDIDCPEADQPFGQQARQHTSTLCLSKTVTVNATGQDRRGRTLAFVTLLAAENIAHTVCAPVPGSLSLPEFFPGILAKGTTIVT